MNAISEAINIARKRLSAIELRLDEPMKNHTSFKIGGPVRAMFLPKNTDELAELMTLFRELGVKPFFMGNGTNLLADDRDIGMIAIKTSGLSALSLTGENEITAGSGVSLARLAVFAFENSLSGFEFAHGIPGTLGGAISMNAGAYGGEMKDVVFKTGALSEDGKLSAFVGEEHGFSYRKSRFTDSGDIILLSAIRLHRGDQLVIGAAMEELARRRKESQPLSYPSAGSTFKRPKDGYAAPLIEEAGLKGFTIGGAQVSEKHAGFVINRGGASFNDVMSVIEHVRETVMRKFGVELELEVRILS